MSKNATAPPVRKITVAGSISWIIRQNRQGSILCLTLDTVRSGQPWIKSLFCARITRLPEHLREHLRDMITREQTRLRDLGYTVATAPEHLERILHESHHKTLGVRPMRATVERRLQGEVIARILDHTFNSDMV